MHPVPISFGGVVFNELDTGTTLHFTLFPKFFQANSGVVATLHYNQFLPSSSFICLPIVPFHNAAWALKTVK
jgi:hypothetical protein